MSVQQRLGLPPSEVHASFKGTQAMLPSPVFRCADKKMTVRKEKDCYTHGSLETGGTEVLRGTQGSPGWPGSRGSRAGGGVLSVEAGGGGMCGLRLTTSRTQLAPGGAVSPGSASTLCPCIRTQKTKTWLIHSNLHSFPFPCVVTKHPVSSHLYL